MTAQEFSDTPRAGMNWPVLRRMLMWLMLSVLAALLAYAGFRGYLSAELLFHFANGMHC
jgi:hypothetical protein